MLLFFEICLLYVHINNKYLPHVVDNIIPHHRGPKARVRTLRVRNTRSASNNNNSDNIIIAIIFRIHPLINEDTCVQTNTYYP